MLFYQNACFLYLCALSLLSMIKIKLPDGSQREYRKGISSMDIAKSISEGLARNVLVAKVNGEVQDLLLPINEDSTFELLSWKDEAGKATMWHSSAHLMAEAFEELYPGVKLAIGPPIARGFYYDIDFGDYQISEKDLPKVEQKMKELAKQKSTFTRKEVSKSDAIKYFQEKKDLYKLELINDLEDGSITSIEDLRLRKIGSNDKKDNEEAPTPSNNRPRL